MHRLLTALSRWRQRQREESVLADHATALPPVPRTDATVELDTTGLREAGRAAMAQCPLATAPTQVVDLRQVLADGERTLRRVHHRLSAAERARHPLGEAGHWLLDNDYLLQEQIQECRLGLDTAVGGEDLPLGVARTGVGAPRVFLLLRELVARRAGALTAPEVHAFIDGAQQHSPLTLAELWSVPMMLRLALLDQLAHVAQALGPSARSDPIAAPVDHPADAEVMRHAIGSLRAIARTNWSRMVERLSGTEQTLRRDPAGVYAQMDFSTRERYRRKLVRSAQRSGRSEQAAADLLLDTASRAPAGGDPATHHVGYWLLGPGQDAFERQLGLRASLPYRLRRWLLRRPSWFYLGAIAAIAADVALLAVGQMQTFGVLHALLTAAALFVAASHLAVALINWLITLALPPRPLPRMDFSAGVPTRWRTLVAMPCMLGSAQEVAELAAALERHHLGNRDPNIFYALVSDFVDAPQQEMPADAALRDAACAAINALNTRYASAGAPAPFALLHRDRLYNASERVWMGWERKRGKLVALNRFLRGQGGADVHLLAGDGAALQGTAFVITLDADTRLPPEAAQRLIATLAHPLNRPVWDRKQGRVTQGYGVLQPRVSVGALRGGASLLARLYSDEIKLDPYTGIVSDVYQDLYREASYVGKGIYDVDCFLHAVGERFADNQILSHDLLEGSYARTGLVSDVELFEYHPDSYLVDMQRRHRWTRGDWQIWPWLLPRVPGPQHAWQPNPLSTHQCWKLLDNLRRSLVPAALLFVLVNGWLLTRRPVLWTLVVLLVLFASPLLISLDDLFRRNPRMPWRTHVHLVRHASGRRLLQAALPLVMLPFETVLCLDAIVRSQWRLWVSHRLRLQWTPAQHRARGIARGVAEFYRRMWVAPVVALAVAIPAVWLLWQGEHRVLVALPFLALWLVAPWLGWRISTPVPRTSPRQLDAAQCRWLRQVARRSWRFFEDTVGPQSHALPPDNFQEIPQPQLAARTSPTNVGMYLLACLSAWDFGYISRAQLLARVAATLDTLDRLPRHRGHFYNWYDTGSLQPLQPAYVSTVDSGNLIACLLLLARGLQTLDPAPALPPQAWLGLQDSWRVLREVAAQGGAPAQSMLDLVAEDVQQIDAVLLQDANPDLPLATQVRQLHVLQSALAHMQSVFVVAAAGTGPSGDRTVPTSAWADLQHWLGCLQTQCQAWVQELAISAPAPDIAGAQTQDESQDGGGEPCEPQTLAARCRALAQVDYDFLYLPEQKLLAIGYHPGSDTLDAGVYDLLASEARLGSFVAIAQGHLPLEHWLAMSRLLVATGAGAALLSWSGSMFEYLMPQLLVPAIENTLLTRSCRNIVARQIEYGRQQGIPWGISESAFNRVDASGTYQYHAFGVPGLGLRRGLDQDLVVAPYASALALMVRPHAAVRNLQRLAQLGAVGRYGFYEALDYTPQRIPAGADFALVRSYMAHHQGMLFNALSAVLNDFALQRRFMQEPMFSAYQLLLEEKIPPAFSLEAGALLPREGSIGEAASTVVP